MTRDARIIVAGHKPYWMPEDRIYLPVQVGNGVSIGWARDDEGENIAARNEGYCELTALYWALHNAPGEAIGLVHYRRHFAEPGARGDKQARVLSGDTLRLLLHSQDMLLPRPRRYWIETNRSQYVHAHHERDLNLLREAVMRREPAYLDSFDLVMRRTWGHRFNMFVMKRPLADAYGDWLFGILFSLEGQIDTSAYSAYDRRIYGFLGERLLDVWVEKEGIPYGELPCLYMEDINWTRKTVNFLRRKAGLGNLPEKTDK